MAEKIIFNEISSGAMDDLEKVTKLAYNMIAYYGLNDDVGPISYLDSSGRNEQILTKTYSENMVQLIDKLVQELIAKAYTITKNLLLGHKGELNELAQLLLNKEIANKEDLENILGKRKQQKAPKN